MTILSPQPELTPLLPLVGGWRAEGHTQDSVLGPGVPVTSTEEFRWLEGGYFLVQTYDTVFGDGPAQRGVNYWYHDAGAGRLGITFFSNNGPYTEEGNRYRGEATDGRLTFQGPARFQYELDDQGRVKLNPDGTVTVAWWLRGQDGDWRPWMPGLSMPRCSPCRRTFSPGKKVSMSWLFQETISSFRRMASARR